MKICENHITGKTMLCEMQFISKRKWSSRASAINMAIHYEVPTLRDANPLTHDVVATLNQRHWRWFNVATTSFAQWEENVKQYGGHCHQSAVEPVDQVLFMTLKCPIAPFLAERLPFARLHLFWETCSRSMINCRSTSIQWLSGVQSVGPALKHHWANSSRVCRDWTQAGVINFQREKQQP